MAKQTHDREDLMRDGTQMPIRGLIVIDQQEVFVGFRTGGQASLYWDQDPVFQFDAEGSLRRAFVDSVRYLAANGKLQSLASPDRNKSTTQRMKLARQTLTGLQTEAILELLLRCLAELRLAHETMARWQTLGATPEQFADRVTGWLDSVGDEIRIADSPSI